MGVYIKNIKMPKKGEKCPFNGYASRYGFVCFLDVEIACRSEDKRASRCPLIEVKAPHGRLIDADKAIRDNKGIYDEAMINELLNDKALPTVIEAEVE